MAVCVEHGHPDLPEPRLHRRHWQRTRGGDGEREARKDRRCSKTDGDQAHGWLLTTSSDRIARRGHSTHLFCSELECLWSCAVWDRSRGAVPWDPLPPTPAAIAVPPTPVARRTQASSQPTPLDPRREYHQREYHQ